MKRLDGKVALITGIGSGMGRAAARLFAAEGAKVVGCDINPAACEETAADVRKSGGEIACLAPCDPSDAEQANALVDFAIEKFGALDVVYNNAAFVEMAWIEDMTPDMWTRSMRGELDIVFNVVRAAWPHLKAQGGGSIINCGSVSGKQAFKVLPGVAHMAGKGGVIAMTKQMACEGGPHGIRVNSISPGLVRTAATEAVMQDKEFLTYMTERLMLNGRIGEPEDIAYCALYLASNESRWVTGADFAIDGGTTAW